MKYNKDKLGGVLIMLLLLGLMVLYAYLVATSRMPDWFKFWLLS